MLYGSTSVEEQKNPTFARLEVVVTEEVTKLRNTFG
jgi:hypothetical protein